MAFYFGIFLATAFLPMLAYLLFTCTIVSLGVFLLAFVESEIIAMTTISDHLSMHCERIVICPRYPFYVAVSEMKTLGSSSLNDSEKRFAREDFKLRCDEKPSLKANIRSRGVKRRSKSMQAGLAQWCECSPSSMCPGFDSRTRRHRWAEFVGFLLCSERFFSWYSGFPLSSKTNI